MEQSPCAVMKSTDASNHLTPLVCPGCRAPLQRTSLNLVCDQCHHRYSENDGIVDVRLNRDAYFAEFNREKMSRLLAAIPQDSVRGALNAILREDGAPPRLGEYILGSGRAGWKFLLPLGPDSAALDLGCGWGTLAFSLADSCARVVAMDSTLERMKFLQLRAKEQGQNRLEFVCGGDGRHLPFEDNAFDMVVVNGVLEWVPCGSNDDPRTAQLKFLREIRRVLRESGRLFIAIENRYSWKTWFRDADGHSGLRFVPWLPRAIANAYSVLRGRGRFRNYLYGEKQLRSLLDTAGFTQAAFFVPLPGYHHPASIVPLENKPAIYQDVSNPVGIVRNRLRRKVRAILDSRFPGNFSVVAGASTPTSSFLEKLLEHLQLRVTAQQATKPNVETYRINGEMGMVTLVVRFGDHRHVLKLPLDARAKHGLEREVENLREVARGSHPLSGLREFMARVVDCGDFEGQFYAVLNFVPGATGDRLVANRSLAPNLFANATEFLAKLHKNTADSSVRAEQSLAEMVRQNAEAVGKLAGSSSQSAALDRFADRLVAGWRKTPLPLVVGHGDFKLANCVFDPADGRLTGVIDWGAGFGPEVALHDFAFLLVEYDSRSRGTPLAKALARWIGAETLPVDDFNRMNALAERLQVPFSQETIKCLGAHQWLKRMVPLADGYECRRFDHRYVDGMFSVISADK
jgi:ubiquinone/menaquinone biosynthesis C-methylase UbiE/aminoglycoside phosphotransferase (APT) family kinase protein